MINKIWKDPVWSKVIAVIIVFIGTTAIAKLQSYLLNVNFFEAFKKLVFTGVPIIYIFCSVLIYWIVRFLLRKKGKPSIFEKQKAELLKFKETRPEGTGLLIKWELYFDGNTPVVYDLTIFCIKHGVPPLKFVRQSAFDDRMICPTKYCSKLEGISYDNIVNLIESLVIHQWDEIRKNNS